MNNKQLLESGEIMYTHNVVVFKFRGKYYTTNKNRKKKYRMNYYKWNVSAVVCPTLYKIYMIMLGKVKEV